MSKFYDFGALFAAGLVSFGIYFTVGIGPALIAAGLMLFGLILVGAITKWA